jgi:hypothetical protein
MERLALVIAILDEELVLPAGMMVTDIAWEWVARACRGSTS